MTAIAGHTGLIRVHTDNITSSSSTASTLDGCTSIDFGLAADLLDTTDFSSSAYRERIQALRDVTVTLTCDLETADTAQGYLRASYFTDAACYIGYFPAGTNAGWSGRFKVGSIGLAASVDGKVGAVYTCSLNADADDGPSDGGGGGLDVI